MTDLALVNANVLTMDPARPRASAVAIAQAGSPPWTRSRPAPARVVDLRGATVLPGFHDAHNHMIGFGMSLGRGRHALARGRQPGRAVRGGRPPGGDDGRRGSG